MRILISNDDGVLAPGLMALYEALNTYAECCVVAPMQDRSGASSSLTLDRPLYPLTLPNGFVGVDGSPTDCVHLGLNGLITPSPDWVVSGINLGANLGDDVLYSGTVAAAIEGRFTGHPALAFSLASRQVDNLATAAYVARRMFEQLPHLALPARTVLNVNVPNLPLARIQGIQLTRLGHRQRTQPPVRHVNPRGKEGFWISAAGNPEDAGVGTDFHALLQGYVSVTPLQLDRTFQEAFSHLELWIGDLL